MSIRARPLFACTCWRPVSLLVRQTAPVAFKRTLANREQRDKDRMRLKQQREKKLSSKGPERSSYDTSACRARMDVASTRLKQQLATLRVGRASPSFLDAVVVNAYGAPTPLKAVAQVTVKSAQLLLVNVHDSGLVKAVEKAISEAKLGVEPSIEGSTVHVPFPKPTRELRDELIKQAHKLAEDTKNQLRHARREAMDDLKKRNLPQDENTRAKQALERLTADATNDATLLLREKEKELNAV